MDKRSFIEQIDTYIETTVMALGFSKQEFLEYLKSKKPNGDNLGNWNMDELMNYGNEFITKNQDRIEKFPDVRIEEVTSSNIYIPPQAKYPQFNNYQSPNIAKDVSIPKDETLINTPQPQNSFEQQQNIDRIPQQPPQQTPQQPIQQIQQQPQFNVQNQITPPLQNAQVNLNQMQQPIEQQYIMNNPPLPLPLAPQVNGSDMQRYKLYPSQQMVINQNSFLYKNPNIDVKIVSYKEQSGSLFSKSYILYQIVLQPYGYTINRRYSDFDKLREYLLKNYPEFYIPPIPKKVTGSTKPETADYRQIALERFMNMILKQFWFDAYVDAFFSCQNENELANRLRSQSQRTYTIDKIQTLTGQVECQISQQIDTYFQYIQQNIDKDAECFRHIREISKRILVNNKSICQDIKLLGEQFTNLSQRAKLQNDIIPEKIDEQSYKNLSYICQSWSKKQEEFGNVISKQLTHFYKYQNQVQDIIKETIKNRDLMREETLKQLQKIDAKQGKYQREKSASIDGAQFNQFPNQLKSYELCQDNFGYVNNSLYQQIQLALNLQIYQEAQSIQEALQRFVIIYIDLAKENDHLLR